MADLDDGLADLRSGVSLWQADNGPGQPLPVPRQLSADVIIIGAGITGAFLAERLSRRGHSVIMIDRHAPQQGSTAASTALLQWELDVPMLELEQKLGFAAAASVYQRSHQSVRGIGRLVRALAIRCNFRHRNSLYLAGDSLDPAALREERRLRALAGIEGDLLGEGELLALEGFLAPAALRYQGSAEADPVALARGLLASAGRMGAKVLSPAVATDYDATVAGVVVRTDAGIELVGKALVLANGYEMPGFVPADSHAILSTWAFATEPMPERLWRTRALVWQASDPYIYMRTTADGRIVAGGGDEPITDPGERDKLIQAKTRAVVEKIAAILPAAGQLEPAYRWSGFFGQTEDGMPLIGAVPGMPRCFAAFGYGGNGITFSMLAAQLIDGLLIGRRDPILDLLALDRTG
jgi:glycine/D-amino acid oxidase-like deaminating enzyme